MDEDLVPSLLLWLVLSGLALALKLVLAPASRPFRWLVWHLRARRRRRAMQRGVAASNLPRRELPLETVEAYRVDDETRRCGSQVRFLLSSGVPILLLAFAVSEWQEQADQDWVQQAVPLCCAILAVNVLVRYFADVRPRRATRAALITVTLDALAAIGRSGRHTRPGEPLSSNLRKLSVHLRAYTSKTAPGELAQPAVAQVGAELAEHLQVLRRELPNGSEPATRDSQDMLSWLLYVAVTGKWNEPEFLRAMTPVAAKSASSPAAVNALAEGRGEAEPVASGPARDASASASPRRRRWVVVAVSALLFATAVAIFVVVGLDVADKLASVIAALAALIALPVTLHGISTRRSAADQREGEAARHARRDGDHAS